MVTKDFDENELDNKINKTAEDSDEALEKLQQKLDKDLELTDKEYKI